MAVIAECMFIEKGKVFSRTYSIVKLLIAKLKNHVVDKSIWGKKQWRIRRLRVSYLALSFLLLSGYRTSLRVNNERVLPPLPLASSSLAYFFLILFFVSVCNGPSLSSPWTILVKTLSRCNPCLIERVLGNWIDTNPSTLLLLMLCLFFTISASVFFPHAVGFSDVLEQFLDILFIINLSCYRIDVSQLMSVHWFSTYKCK